MNASMSIRKAAKERENNLLRIHKHSSFILLQEGCGKHQHSDKVLLCVLKETL